MRARWLRALRSEFPTLPIGYSGHEVGLVPSAVAVALGACMVEHGVTPAALAAFDKKLCGPISQVVLRNRGAGPFGLLNMVDERCGGTFDNIDDAIPPKERAKSSKSRSETARPKVRTVPGAAVSGRSIPALHQGTPSRVSSTSDAKIRMSAASGTIENEAGAGFGTAVV